MKKKRKSGPGARKNGGEKLKRIIDKERRGIRWKVQDSKDLVGNI